MAAVLDPIEDLRNERSERFTAEWDKRAAEWKTAFGLRATLLPRAPVHVDALDDLCPPAGKLKLVLNGAGISEIDPCMTSDHPPRLVTETSQGRGVRGVEIAGHDWRAFMLQDGLIEYWTIYEVTEVFPGNPMALVGNALLAVEVFRQACKVPQVEFELEVEIRAKGDVQAIDYSLRYKSRPLGPIPKCQRLPPHIVGRKEDFGSVWSQVEKDFWRACYGKPWTTIAVDWNA